jgi:hypothetical protein
MRTWIIKAAREWHDFAAEIFIDDVSRRTQLVQTCSDRRAIAFLACNLAIVWITTAGLVQFFI